MSSFLSNKLSFKNMQFDQTSKENPDVIDINKFKDYDYFKYFAPFANF